MNWFPVAAVDEVAELAIEVAHTRAPMYRDLGFSWDDEGNYHVRIVDGYTSPIGREYVLKIPETTDSDELREWAHTLVDTAEASIGTYIFTGEDDCSEKRIYDGTRRELAEAVKGGDETVWGDCQGCSPESTGGDVYALVLPPEQEGWEPPVRLVRIL